MKKIIYLICWLFFSTSVSTQTRFSTKKEMLHEYKPLSSMKKCLEDIVELDGGGQWELYCDEHTEQYTLLHLIATPSVDYAASYSAYIKVKNATILLKDEAILQDSILTEFFFKGDMRILTLDCYIRNENDEIIFDYPDGIIDYPERFVAIGNGCIYLLY